MAAILLAGALAGCTSPEGAMVRARAGDFVRIDLVAHDEAGAEVQRLTGAKAVMAAQVPPRLPEGWDAEEVATLPPGVVDALAGQVAGSRIVTGLLAPEEAYGAWSEERTIQAPREESLPRTFEVEVAQLTADGRKLSWANQSWGVEVQARHDDRAEVHLATLPEPGAVLELPAYWNAHYQMWRSRLTGADADALHVVHEAEVGREASVGGVRYVVVDDGTDTGTGTGTGTGAASTGAGVVVADGNPPLAGKRLRFEATLHEVVFAGSGAFPVAPDALIVPVEGAPVNVSEYRGRAVLLDFFATWCVTCKQQAPILARAEEHFGDRLAVVSITIDPTDDAGRIAAFRKDAASATVAAWGRDVPVDWTFAFDPTGQAARAFSVTGIPRSVLIDPDGRIRSSGVGLEPWGELRADVETALGSTGPSA